jgi:hypothetical protein
MQQPVELARQTTIKIHATNRLMSRLTHEKLDRNDSNDAIGYRNW